MNAEEMKRGIRTAYADGAYTGAGQAARLVEFDRMIAEVERAAAVRALEEPAQSYPFTLMGVGATWHEAQKVLCERAAEIREGKVE